MSRTKQKWALTVSLKVHFTESPLAMVSSLGLQVLALFSTSWVFALNAKQTKHSTTTHTRLKLRMQCVSGITRRKNFFAAKNSSQMSRVNTLTTYLLACEDGKWYSHFSAPPIARQTTVWRLPPAFLVTDPSEDKPCFETVPKFFNLKELAEFELRCVNIQQLVCHRGTMTFGEHFYKV